jgi:Secretion system C-terminal sorting domain
MRNILIIFLAIVYTMRAYSQPNDAKRDNIWSLGYDCRVFNPPNPHFGSINLDFNFNPPTIYRNCPNIYDLDVTKGSICDTSGNLIMLTNGYTLEDGHGNTIQNGGNFGVDYNPNGLFARRLPQAALILPRPDHDDEYLFFSTAYTNMVATNPLYARNSGMGTLYLNHIKKVGGRLSVVNRNILLNNDTLSGGRVLACRHANGRDWWIVVPRKYDNKYFRYLLTDVGNTTLGQSTGVDYIGSQEIGPVIYDPIWGQACFSPDGRYYARAEGAYGYGGVPLGLYVCVYDFNRCTGLMSNARYWHRPDTTQGGFISFSENSRYMYVADGYTLYQTDITQPHLRFDTIAVYNGSIDSISGLPRLIEWMQLAPNGKIYLGSESVRYIHIIENPNLGGVGCNFNQAGLDLGVFNAFSLPHYPYFRLGREVGSGCDTVYLRSEELRIEEGMKVWPNPAQNMLNIQILPLLPPSPQRGKEVRLAITDVLGRVVYEEVVVGETISLDVSVWANGMYFVSLKTEKGIVFSKKVIIER